MNNINLEEIFTQCMEFSNKIKNKDLKECCQKILIDYKEKLIKKPATTGSHHYFEGGLLYHIYCVARNAIAILKLYPELNVDSDLVIFGALLHDIGKGNTPEEILPHHYGHEIRGEKIVENFGKIIGVPKKWIQCGKIAAKEHMRGRKVQ